MQVRIQNLFVTFTKDGQQPQGHVQVLLNMLRGFSPQAALDAPRFCISPGLPDQESSSTGSAGDINSEVYFEDGFAKETIAKLRGLALCLGIIHFFN